MYITQVMSEEESKYWFTKRYCFKCKQVTQFMRCDNCGKFFCEKSSGELDSPEYGDYGSIIAPASLFHAKCL